jgi:hypothetical protein
LTPLVQSSLQSFLHFPVPKTVLSMSDDNWGPQDASLFIQNCGVAIICFSLYVSILY